LTCPSSGSDRVIQVGKRKKFRLSSN
jgi:hypothetical protein